MRKIKLLKVYGSECYACGGNTSFANAVRDADFADVSDEDYEFLRTNLYRLSKRDECYIIVEDYTDKSNFEEVFDSINQFIEKEKEQYAFLKQKEEERKAENARKRLERKERQLEKLKKELEELK